MYLNVSATTVPKSNTFWVIDWNDKSNWSSTLFSYKPLYPNTEGPIWKIFNARLTRLPMWLMWGPQVKLYHSAWFVKTTDTVSPFTAVVLKTSSPDKWSLAEGRHPLPESTRTPQHTSRHVSHANFNRFKLMWPATSAICHSNWWKCQCPVKMKLLMTVSFTPVFC